MVLIGVNYNFIILIKFNNLKPKFAKNLIREIFALDDLIKEKSIFLQYLII